MSRDKPDLLTMSIDTVARKKFEIFDVNLSTAFTLQSATWELRRQTTGELALNGGAPANNADTDRAGNTIKTIEFGLDLRDTDVPAGYYWLVIEVTLVTLQTDVFRYPVEILDLKGGS